MKIPVLQTEFKDRPEELFHKIWNRFGVHSCSLWSDDMERNCNKKHDILVCKDGTLVMSFLEDSTTSIKLTTPDGVVFTRLGSGEWMVERKIAVKLCGECIADRERDCLFFQRDRTGQTTQCAYKNEKAHCAYMKAVDQAVLEAAKQLQKRV